MLKFQIALFQIAKLETSACFEHITRFPVTLSGEHSTIKLSALILRPQSSNSSRKLAR